MNNAVRAIGSGAVIAGILDAIFAVIAYVFVLRAFSVLGVLQYIASGLIGMSAFSGGLLTAALGVAIHFFLAFAFATLYFVASRRLGVLRTNVVPIGIAYGMAIWIFMDLVVLPFTGTPKSPFNGPLFTGFLLDHAFFVGLPIALAIRRYGG
jgi:hypothetical protein